MKKIVLLLTILIVSNFSFSQNLEEKIAIRACECLENKSTIDDDVYRTCVSQSMAEIVLGNSDSKIREAADTVAGMQNILKKVYGIMPITCENEKMRASEIRKDQFYSDSKNKNAQNSYLIAQDLINDKKYKLAIQGLEMSLKQDKNFVLAYDNMAFCYRQLNDFDKAIKYYKKSLDIFPEGDFALMNIAVLYSKKSDFKSAIAYYNKLIKFYPKSAEGYYGAGQNYFLIEDYENALSNIFIAHRIYTEEASDYVTDSEKILGMMYQKLKSENKEDLFIKFAERNNVQIN